MDIKSVNPNGRSPSETVSFPKETKTSSAANPNNPTTPSVNSDKSNAVPSEKKVSVMVDNINSFINQINYKIQFKIMRDYENQMVIQVVDMEKDKVIRQIPPEYLLKIEKTLAEINGLITDETA
ncbi:MAG: flagellar protein FlaG [Candidatus Delongbacteria bacterium]|nr:flagellar protein FlaG [Candidatus Delongbacteria bacterium]